MAATATASKRSKTGTKKGASKGKSATPVTTTPAAAAVSALPKKLVNFSDVERGDLMAILTFVKVEHKSSFGGSIGVRNVDSGMPFSVNGTELVEVMYSADRFMSEEKLTQTQLAETLITLYNTPFTVEFVEKDGTERTLRGRLVSHEIIFGRSKVVDLDITSGYNMRLVDHRTIKSIIANGVKYSLKKK